MSIHWHIVYDFFYTTIAAEFESITETLKDTSLNIYYLIICKKRLLILKLAIDPNSEAENPSTLWSLLASFRVPN